MRIAGAALLLLLLSSVPVRAQIAPGHVHTTVKSAYDTTQTYAVYLPSTYAPGHTYPVALLMDPRGRAVFILNRFKAAAEQRGWILISSYNTLSDGPSEPNANALNAMLSDLRASFQADWKRLYLITFSGTSRLSWVFANQLRGNIAGILGVGASGFEFAGTLPSPLDAPRIAYYGGAGVTDFNYDEMQNFEPWLERAQIAHRMRYYPGGHAWIPDSLTADVLAWFDARAMRTGLLTRDDAFLDSMYKADTRRARMFEAAGRPVDALQQWKEIYVDHPNHADSAAVRIEELGRNKQLQRALKQRMELARESSAYGADILTWTRNVRTAAQPPKVEEGVEFLKIEKLKKLAADSSDIDRALSVQRRLENAFVMLSFYEPRDLLRAGKADMALLQLDIAERIHANNPGVASMRAQVNALRQTQ